MASDRASQPVDGVKAILGNPLMIKAYNEGFPANHQTIPDGAMMAKIAWSMKSNPLLPGAAMVPDTLKKVQFMIKDAKRFRDKMGGATAISPMTRRRPRSRRLVTARRLRRRRVTSVIRVWQRAT